MARPKAQRSLSRARIAAKSKSKTTGKKKIAAKPPKPAARAKPGRKPASPAGAKPSLKQRVKNSVGKIAKRVAKVAKAPAAKLRVAKPAATDDLTLLQDLVRMAQKAGADTADALVARGVQVAVGQRLGEREKLERSEGHDLGLRVLIGKRQAMVSTTDFSSAALQELAARAVAMAKAVPEDPFCGIADGSLLAKRFPQLDIDPAAEPSVEWLEQQCKIAEDAARSVKGVTNSEGAEASWSRTQIALVISNGFAGSYSRSGFGLSASVLAGQDTGMERDYEWTSAVHARDLMPARKVGQRAGQRAVKRLNPRVAKSAKVPVVYDPRVSGSLLGHLSGAINGRAIARGTSFLKDRMGKAVFAPGIAIIDDPLRKRGQRSKPFDGEGLPTRRYNVIDDGVLTTWLLDLASAWQLKLPPTGHAARGTGGPPSPSSTNLYMAPGKLTPKRLMADIKSGFYVTELIGFGVNGVTGDYSRGASGFWIENGELSYPVSGVTVAGNLKDMFAKLTPANDLEFKTGTDAPTIRLDNMTVAGS
jgi:PmbA protein